jgi:hypothetical protein
MKKSRSIDTLGFALDITGYLYRSPVPASQHGSMEWHAEQKKSR